jgi:predicted choloylglycine hydrolase
MKPSEIKLLKLKGNPKTRGIILGKQLKSLIKKHLNIIKLLIFEYYQTNPKEIIDNFFKNTKILDAAKKYTPHLIEEFEGIAEGSGYDFYEIFAAQCIDELVWYKDEFNNRASNQCSAIGILNNKATSPFLAQNVDHMTIFKNFNVILHIYDSNSSLETYVYTLSGLIALTGLNNRAIGVCTNGLSLVLNYSTKGLPVSLVVREILSQKTFDDAIEFIRKVDHASGQNYLIGGPEDIACFECSGNRVVQYIPYENADKIYHTNHALVNDDLINSSLNITDIVGENSSLRRFNYLESCLKHNSNNFAFKDIEDILCFHQGSICRHTDKPENSSTLASVIYSLSNPPEFYFANGNPCSINYKKFRFD